MDYQLHEGSIALAEGFQDRTVNMFVLGNSIPAPLSITISRDTMLPAEEMKTYIARQIKMIASKLRGYTLLEKKPAFLSADQSVEGIQVDAYYLNDGRPIYQRQAAFVMEPGRVLVFSTTSQIDFNAEQNGNWLELLASFQPRLATPQSTDLSEPE